MTAPRARKAAPDAFDSYWAEMATTKTETIRGVTINLPTDVPMVIEQRLTDLQESSNDEDIAELLTLLFGVDAGALDTWKNNGMGTVEFQVLIIWGMSHADGNPMTVEEAHGHVMKALAEGKAQSPPNRAARRASSASTGGRSARTSGRTTASARKNSAR